MISHALSKKALAEDEDTSPIKPSSSAAPALPASAAPSILTSSSKPSGGRQSVIRADNAWLKPVATTTTSMADDSKPVFDKTSTTLNSCKETSSGDVSARSVKSAATASQVDVHRSDEANVARSGSLAMGAPVPAKAPPAAPPVAEQHEADTSAVTATPKRTPRAFSTRLLSLAKAARGMLVPVRSPGPAAKPKSVRSRKAAPRDDDDDEDEDDHRAEEATATPGRPKRRSLFMRRAAIAASATGSPAAAHNNNAEEATATPGLPKRRSLFMRRAAAPAAAAAAATATAAAEDDDDGKIKAKKPRGGFFISLFKSHRTGGDAAEQRSPPEEDEAEAEERQLAWERAGRMPADDFAQLVRGLPPVSVRDAAETLILKAGASYLVIARASQNAPCSVVPALEGRPKSFNQKVGGNNAADDKDEVDANKDAVYGSEAVTHAGIYALKHATTEVVDELRTEPRVHTDYDMLNRVSVFALDSDARLPRCKHPVLLLEPCNATNEYRSAMYKLCFQSLGAPAVFQVNEALAALVYHKKTRTPTGLVLDIGQYRSRAVPILDGQVLHASVRESRAAGDMLVKRMQRLLKEKGHNLSTSGEWLLVQDMMEKAGVIAASREEYAKAVERATYFSSEDYAYEMPDGASIVLNKERYACMESLFYPSLDKSLDHATAPSIQDIVYAAILQIDDAAVKMTLSKNVLVIGGGAKAKGLVARLKAEIKTYSAPVITNNIAVSVPDSEWAAFRGAKSMLESDDALASGFIGHKQYAQFGDRLVNYRANATM